MCVFPDRSAVLLCTSWNNFIYCIHINVNLFHKQNVAYKLKQFVFNFKHYFFLHAISLHAVSFLTVQLSLWQETSEAASGLQASCQLSAESLQWEHIKTVHVFGFIRSLLFGVAIQPELI